MAVLTSQEIVRTGLNPSYSSAAGAGDSFANTGTEFIHVKNGSGSSMNVTVETTVTVDSLDVEDLVVAVPAAGERLIGPFPCRWYGTSVGISYSDETSVTLAVIKPGT